MLLEELDIPPTKKHETPYIFHKNQLKVDQGPKGKTQYYKLVEGEMGFGLGDECLDTTPKA